MLTFFCSRPIVAWVVMCALLVRNLDLLFSCSFLWKLKSAEEMAHIDPDLFFKVVVPILQMRNTALLGLSSPEGSR